MALNLNNLPDEEYVAPGRKGCPGCPAVIGARMTSKVLGKEAMMVNSTGCMCVNYGYAGATRFPYIHSLFPNAGAVVSGIDTGLRARGEREDVNLFAYCGDGGTVDIGFQALSGAVERGHRFLYICYDNEGYMNTGGQRSGATPYTARTSTTPVGSKNAGEQRLLSRRKDMVRTMAGHGIPYTASASVAYPVDFMRKVKKAVAIDGPSYIHLLTPCITGWGFDESQGVSIARMAVKTCISPLYEVENGREFRITKDIKQKKPITDYLKLQGRFKHLFVNGEVKDKQTAAEIDRIQRDIDNSWAYLQDISGSRGGN